MGDLNSLSSLDNYDEKELLKEMKKLNTHKFTSRFGESHLRKEVISKIQEFGLVDALKLFSDKFEYSVPTTFNKDVDHITKLRLDYIFVTNDLKKFVKDIQIIRNDETDRLSDHFPILIEIE
jgi:exodeoxyribonuclease-3